MTKTGQRKPLAQAKINLADLVGENSDEKVFKEVQNLELRGYKGEIKIKCWYDITFQFLDRVQDVKLSLHLAGVLLKTGEATDEDLQSLASMLSITESGNHFGNMLPLLFIIEAGRVNAI